MAALLSRALACVLLIAAPFVVRADAPPSVFLEDLTSPELAARIRAGATTVIIPIGGTEQNGAHMSLGKHNVRVKLLSERIARSLGNALVAPVVAYVPEGGVNPPTAHMRYPGTITVPTDVYRGVIESAARSLRLAGFRDIVLLGDHGDYQKDSAAVAAKLDKEWAASPVRVHAIGEYYRAATSEFSESLRKQGFSDKEIGLHAGLSDTSLMLAVDPKVVRTDRMQKSEGVTGDPQRATAQLGQAAADAIVLQTVAAIRAATQRK
jgi:creatinine amidohydrolase/Fe(II)-dependent formamide hydrolase-like protein